MFDIILVTNRKIIIFYVYFFNMDISLNMALIFLLLRSVWRESVSHNSDIGLSFCFMLSMYKTEFLGENDKNMYTTIRLLFDALFVIVAFIDPTISPFY